MGIYILCVVSFLIVAAGLVAGTKYADYYIKQRDESFTKAYFSPRFLIPIIVAIGAFAVFSAISMTLSGNAQTEPIRSAAVLCALTLSSITDLRLKLIPNIFSLSLIIFWVVETIAELVFFNADIVITVGSSLVGGLFGGGLLLIGRLISRNGMGMGDVKIMFAAGLLLRFDRAFGLIFWALLFALICGILLMIIKKVKSSSTLCMAPFFLAGAIAENLAEFISYIVYGGTV